MNEGQRKFYEFIMSIIKDDKKILGENLLKKCFSAQDAGIFNKEFLMNIIPELKSYVKESEINKLEQAISHFSSNLK